MLLPEELSLRATHHIANREEKNRKTMIQVACSYISTVHIDYRLNKKNTEKIQIKIRVRLI